MTPLAVLIATSRRCRGFLPVMTLYAATAGCAGPVPAPAPRAPAPGTPPLLELGHHFRASRPIEATFVLLEDASGRVSRYRPERAGRRYRPASTFKIPNTVIALETQVANGPDTVVRWDAARVDTTGFFADSWRGDQTLRSAFRNSVYWVYQELAGRIGAERMQGWLDRFDYGNRSIGGGLDRFWLRGDLAISADEQVRFLRALRRGELGVSERTLAVLDEISVLADGPGWRLHGKTGTSDVTPTRENGWIVGWVQTGEGTWYWALNMEGETVWEDWPPGDRVALVRGILRELGVLPR